jgi:hypothetical protein
MCLPIFGCQNLGPRLDPDPDRYSALKARSGSVSNEYGFETLALIVILRINLVQGLLLMDMSNTVANFAAGFAASQIGATAAAITGKSVTDLAATSVVLAQGNSVRCQSYRFLYLYYSLLRI